MKIDNDKITVVRDREFILGDEISFSQSRKHPGMKCFSATMINENCHGKFSVPVNYIVINYHGYWSYGQTFARAYEEIAEKVFDKNAKLIAYVISRKKRLQL